ncbi:hypothetical protein AAFO90_22780, partial [Phaeobacter sp. CAU 1743]
MFIARNAPLLFAFLLGSMPIAAAADCVPPERPFWGSVWMPPVLQGFPELISSDLIAVVYSASCCGFYAPRAMMVS